MKLIKRLIRQLANIGQAYTRYPLTMLLFISFFVMNVWYIIEEFSGYDLLVQSFLVAIALSLVATHINERFITNRFAQWGLLIAALLLSVGYYLLLPSSTEPYLLYEVRTAVVVFSLLFAFMWVPTIKNKSRYFYQMFLALFKYTFIALLYGGTITLGFQAIISTIDVLFFSISYDYFIHAANLVWLIFVPSYLLSLIPRTEPYKQVNERIPEQVLEAFTVPTFFQVLINYIVIPLIGIYTVILVVYIALNISGEFWSDNLLEPMLIAYAIVVLFAYLLACNLTEPIAHYFRKIFPKILIPIVLFQTIASVLEIQNLGITHGRYYVILFGVFATLIGLIFSFLRKEKSGWIVPILLVLALISIVPPVDAFSVAKQSQENLLTTTLIENNMLLQNKVIPKATISRADQVKITNSFDYLSRFNYDEEISYLPSDIDHSKFQVTFGFPMIYFR